MNDLPSSPELNRRAFLKGGSVATLMTLMGGIELIAQAAEAEPAAPGNKVRVAVIGCGAWGRELVKMLSRLEQAEIAALCDTYPAALRRCAADAPGAKQVAKAEDILADKDIHAVFIATPTHQHRELVEAALKAGKDVYCEAPLAHTIEDARAIALAAQAAPKQVFQAGLQMRSDKQRIWLLPFIRAGNLGTFVKARAQWHRKTSWRTAAPNPDREKELNWRLERALSPGLLGEIGIHQMDQVAWFLNGRPRAVTGFSSLVQWRDDNRDVPDTVQAVLEFPKGVHLTCDLTLGNSFDAEYEVLYGAYAAVMMRENRAWMFKEADSPLFGWEVYAQKETFHNETGIILMAGSSKQETWTQKLDAEAKIRATPLYAAVENFIYNVGEQRAAIQDFTEAYGEDEAALVEHLKTEVEPKRKPGATALEGFQATVTALKANEAALARKRIELASEWYQLA